jgi:hypothetical protein
MPLVFDSLSHGEVAFGFFNIETDMLLLENYFFFASDLCQGIIDIAAGPPDEKTISLDGYILEYRDIGNLMGAIAGVDLWGFIGEIYNKFPFPHREEDFKQDPDGFRIRNIVETVIRHYAGTTKISVGTDTSSGIVKIGEYLFSNQQFHKLLQYVWVGGYPRWKDEMRPSYVAEMKEKIGPSSHPAFQGIKLI